MEEINGLFAALKISATGLAAQRRRMNAIAENLANTDTTRTDEGGPYRRKVTRFSEKNRVARFRDTLAHTRVRMDTPRIGHIRPVDDPLTKQRFSGVAVDIVRDRSLPETVYDPNHPDADEQGYVELPNVNVITEMVDMISASRAYEANVTAIKATKDMAIKALEI